MTIVPFYPIGKSVMRAIVGLKLGHLADRLAESHKMEMEVEEAVLDAIAGRCTEVETGARNVDHIINGSLMPSISTAILRQMSEGPLPDRLRIALDEAGAFTYAFEDAPSEK